MPPPEATIAQRINNTSRVLRLLSVSVCSADSCIRRFVAAPHKQSVCHIPPCLRSFHARPCWTSVHLHAHELTHGAGDLVLVPTTCEEVGIRCSELLQVSVLSCALSGMCWVLAVVWESGRWTDAAEQVAILFPGWIILTYHYKPLETHDT